MFRSEKQLFLQGGKEGRGWEAVVFLPFTNDNNDIRKAAKSNAESAARNTEVSTLYRT